MSEVSAYAPGRIELLGNHTDYNQGLVLGAAIDRGLTIRGRARQDDLIRLRSRAFADAIDISSGQISRHENCRWANYPLGVVQTLSEAGYPVRGFEADISGDLPPGRGLSSSAALEVATAIFLQRIFHFHLEPLALARLCQKAENDFVGVRSGLLDQATSVFGRAHHVVLLDCRSEEIRLLSWPNEIRFVIADSGAKRELLTGAYNTRREECAQAARALGVASLREVSLAQLHDPGLTIPALLRRRALHVVGENDRVGRAAEALLRGEATALGPLFDESHKSSRLHFENSTPELDRLAERARALPGVLGARLTGGGFGGAVLALVEAARAKATAARLTREFPGSAGAFVCRVAQGAAPHR